MSWTNPRTWVTGENPTAAQFNTHLRDNLNFLYSPDRAMGYRGSNQSIDNSTFTEMILGSEQFDTNGMHDVSGDNEQIFAQSAGIYLAIGQVTFVANATGTRKGIIRKNSGHAGGGGTAWGVTVVDASPASEVTAFQVTALVPLGVGDYVSLWVWQDSGGALNLEGGAELNWLQLIRLGE